MFRAKLTLLSVFALILTSVAAFGQINDEDLPKLPKKEKMNFLKVNLTALPLNNYSLQYERLLTKGIGVALSGRIMPESGLPFKSFLIDKFAEDQESEDIIHGLSLGNHAFTPEVKFYFGKGYGQGFYISLFYRYSEFKLRGMPIEYETEPDTYETLHLSGNLQSHTGGFMLGLQKNLGKVLVLDLWFFGPHAGKGTSILTGKSSSLLTADEQQALRESIDELEIPMLDKSVHVDANGAKVTLDGPWAGIRAGISLGVRF